ncbi:MAG: thiamine pyrophosphate-dependent enzyme [Tepidisphaeraceae bacterium]
MISGAFEEVRKLSEKGNIPCTTTLLGLGAFDELNPRTLHMLGMHGSVYANYAVQEADCLIAIGARFDDRVTGNIATFAPHAKIIHIDIDPSSISKTVDVDVPVVGDARVSLQAMLPLIESRDRKNWFNTIDQWKAKFPFKFFDDTPFAKPQYVIDEINRQTKSEAIITTGVGQHQMWAAQFYRWRYPRQFITSGGLGTMGFGLPAAIGAQLGSPGKTVIDIDGDGSYLMTCYELATMAEYNIPVKAVILNNDFLGMIKQWQDLFYQKRYSSAVDEEPELLAHGGKLRRQRAGLPRQKGRAENRRPDAQPRRPGRRRLPRRPGRTRLPDGPQRQGPARADARHRRPRRRQHRRCRSLRPGRRQPGVNAPAALAFGASARIILTQARPTSVGLYAVSIHS